MQGEQTVWKLSTVDSRPALILEISSETIARQRLHDIFGAIRTLEVAKELSTFNHLGTERADALHKAITILTGEIKILVEGYESDC